MSEDRTTPDWESLSAICAELQAAEGKLLQYSSELVP